MIQKKSILSNKKKPTWQWHREQADSDGGTAAISVSIAIPEQRLASQQLPWLRLRDYRSLAVWRPADPRGELLIRVLLDSAVYYCLNFRLLPSLTPQLPTLRTTTDVVDECTSAGGETDIRPKTTSPLTVSLKLGIQTKSGDTGSVGTSDTRTFSTIGSVLCDQLVPSTEVFDTESENAFLPCRVLESTRLENTRYRLLKLAWPEENAWIPVPLGHHVMVRLYGKSGEPVCRPYTPVCSSTTLDSGVVSELSTGVWISLLVKVYPDGRMSPLLDQLSPGDGVDVSLPMGTVNFSAGVGAGYRSPEALFILAAGSGITPMLRPLAAVLFPAATEQTCAPSVHMICFDRDRPDQVLVGELRRLGEQLPDRFSVLHVLSHPSESLSSTDNFVHDQINENICCLGLFTLHLVGLKPENVQDRALWLICGPRGFNEAAISVAHKWGVPSRCLVVFSG